MSTPTFQIEDLHAWYGESHILHGVNPTVNCGEVVALPGRNDAGHTTTLCVIVGLVGTREGSTVVYDAGGQGVETIDLSTHKIARCDIGHCPEECGTFSSLLCEENLMLPPVLKGQIAGIGNADTSIDEIYETSPNLAGRHQSQGTHLSGSEQQMLAVGRILCIGASLLLLGEISEGLAPMTVQVLARMILMLKKRGYTVVMVEQNFHSAAPLVDWFYVMEHGHTVERFETAQLQGKTSVPHELLGV